MKSAPLIFSALALFVATAFAIVGGEEDLVPRAPTKHLRQVHSGFQPLTKPLESFTVNELIADFVAENVGDVQYVVKDQYVAKHNGVTHTYLRQLVNDREVFNADMNINILPDGSIINFSENFYRGSSSQIYPQFNVLDALTAFAQKRNTVMEKVEFVREEADRTIFSGGNLAIEEIPLRLGYVQTESGELDLAWELVVREPVSWFHAIVSASNNRIVTLIDWTHAESYEVYPVPGVNDPSDGDRDVIVDPYALGGFDLGWHNTGNEQFTITKGNNVEAQDNIVPSDPNKFFADGGEDLKFEFPIDLSKEPIEYLNASVSNLFYVCNIVHDIFYQYGFDEESGNFQRNNFGRGGRENDPVVAYAQDGNGLNNAVFSTPPDGSSGTMRMYLWNRRTPMIDGSLDNGVIIHEYGHGINIRLAGGPSNSGCMSGGEAGGMGEAWGDCWSLMLRWRDEYDMDTVFEMGDYVNGGNGIRLYPYAYNMTINPQTYEYINRPEYSGVHAKGTFYCAALYDTFLTLVEKYGFEDYYNARNMGGNNILLQNMVDSLRLQPCGPNMIDSRDALIMADEINYGGAHVCDIWRVFARRGLGVFAQSVPGAVTEDFTLPLFCRF